MIQPWQAGTLSNAEARIEMVRRSPVYFVDRMPPVQLHHGDADQVVSVSEAQGLIDAMERAGKTAEEFEAHIHPGLDDDQTTLLTTAQGHRDRVRSSVPVQPLGGAAGRVTPETEFVAGAESPGSAVGAFLGGGRWKALGEPRFGVG